MSVFRNWPIVFSVLAIFVLSQPVSATETIILVQDNDYPPYMSGTPSGSSGIYSKVVAAANQRLTGYKIVINAVPWKRAQYLVEHGQAHGLLGTYYKPVLRPWIASFSEPMIEETIFVYCHTGRAKPGWIYPRDYAGLVFGNNVAFGTPGPEFFQMVDAGQIALEEEETTEENLRKLQNGRIDCYVQDSVATERVIAERGYDKIERLVQTPPETGHIGYSRKWTGPVAEAFIADMNQVIRDMRADGTIDKIIEGYLHE